MKKVSNVALHIGARVGNSVQTNFSSKDFEMYHVEGKGITFMPGPKTGPMEHFVPDACIATVRYEKEQPAAALKQTVEAQTSGDELKVEKRTKAYKPQAA